MTKDKWIWMPHPGHLIVSRNCQFHLNTWVGNYIVSTVGEYLPDEPVREIFAKIRKITLTGRGDDRLADYMEKIGYEELGLGRKYETMVFLAKAVPEECCPYRAAAWSELEANGYNDPGKAAEGHLKMCEKWAKKGKWVKPKD